MGVRDEIRDFLLARRARVSPAQAGLAVHGERRGAGVRPGGGAPAAGISVEYYIRLERGNARGFSDDVLTAVAGALRLNVLLRAQRIEHLVLTGIATSGVVLSTLRQAAGLDYRLTVLSDGCLDNDPE